MTHAPFDLQTLYLMRKAIRRRLDGGATVREAAAEGRGIASGREPGCAIQRWPPHREAGLARGQGRFGCHQRGMALVIAPAAPIFGR